MRPPFFLGDIMFSFLVILVEVRTLLREGLGFNEACLPRIAGPPRGDGRDVPVVLLEKVLPVVDLERLIRCRLSSGWFPRRLSVTAKLGLPAWS